MVVSDTIHSSGILWYPPLGFRDPCVDGGIEVEHLKSLNMCVGRFAFPALRASDEVYDRQDVGTPQVIIDGDGMASELDFDLLSEQFLRRLFNEVRTSRIVEGHSSLQH